MIPAQLRQHARWIIWRLEQRAGQVKPTKVPLDHRSGLAGDANDPSGWLTYDAALDAVQRRGATGVGFVLTEDAGWWFLDIDSCLQDDGQWSPIAREMVARFPGAYVEVSHSCRGLHIIGRGRVQPHGCKDEPVGLELYTDKRWVAITGTHGTGDPDSDHTAAVQRLASDRFPLTAGGAPGEQAWQDKAADDWAGPADDDELVRIMLASSKPAGAVLTGRADVRDLWHGNPDALAGTYPDPNGRPWDCSQADAALAQHLAFWTGRNTERMRRLMLRSALKRDKWEEHRTYLWRTISRACGMQVKVYNRPPAVGQQQQLTESTGSRYLTAHEQMTHFAGCVYVRDLHRVLVPDGGLLKSEQFDVAYGGYTFCLDGPGERVTRRAWEAFTQSQAVVFPRAESSCFRPELPPLGVVQEEGRRLVNVYIPVDTTRIQGDVGPFLDLIARMMPYEADRAVLLAYMASLVQHPGVKFQWCPVVQGCVGNGKTVLTRVVSHAVGHRYTHLPNMMQLKDSGGKFTAWLYAKLFIGAEEIDAKDRMDLLEVLKPLVTNDRVEIQGKGVDQFTGDNRANWMMLTNHKDAMRGADVRRYWLNYTAQQDDKGQDLIRDGMGGMYFPRLYRWLRDEGGYAVVNDYLRSYAVPEELDPAGACHRAPTSSSAAEAARINLGPIEQDVLEAAAQGRQGFAGGWVSSLMLDRLLQETGRRNVSHQRRTDILAALGYEPHPALPGGRTTQVLPTEGGKTRLFTARDHAARHLREPADVVRAYLAAQGMGPASVPQSGQLGDHHATAKPNERDAR